MTFFRQARRAGPLCAALLRHAAPLLLCAAPAGIAGGVTRYVAWRPLRLILRWTLASALRRSVRYVTAHHFQQGVRRDASAGQRQGEI
ncbi:MULTISPECIES: hypothetical protein [Edwardsiella]|uniref:Uncharacterized protein n=2 Tax=Edwardsiella anguillarum TaxID=1821960 RepID=A0A076LUF6_9GAMM|nr:MULTISPECIES: hypothetical protein [Edwardsiella]AKM47793.1 hypothetical protein QY76_10975 [Edwardsiella sp. EA181011]GAJ69182.1 hypothetical protein MA13_contig00021-0016 [Edwardsiella piscicida]AIJ10317.1 Hypothetical protein ETEE_3908 [Edwardsiella anguillarum ET080813]KAB0592031.1 hypothetical protein F7P84_06650 [Edwardsiella anguillarum]MDA6077673.1 hypothetical protein [Edwardsiella anguillarum]